MANEWLGELDQRVEKAIRELERRGRENKSLKAQVERLTKQLAEAESAGTATGGWEAERALIRQRVEKLVHGLERLAGPDEAA